MLFVFVVLIKNSGKRVLNVAKNTAFTKLTFVSLPFRKVSTDIFQNKGGIVKKNGHKYRFVNFGLIVCFISNADTDFLNIAQKNKISRAIRP